MRDSPPLHAKLKEGCPPSVGEGRSCEQGGRHADLQSILDVVLPTALEDLPNKVVEPRLEREHGAQWVGRRIWGEFALWWKDSRFEEFGRVDWDDRCWREVRCQLRAEPSDQVELTHALP